MEAITSWESTTSMSKKISLEVFIPSIESHETSDILKAVTELWDGPISIAKAPENQRAKNYPWFGGEEE